MSKGSKPRPFNMKKFNAEYERLFGSKQPATPEEITYEENIYHNGNHCLAKVLRNCVHPEIGRQIFEYKTKKRSVKDE